MANAHDLRLAILQLGREDTGSGSLVELTGKSRPIVRWKDGAEIDRPRIAMVYTSAPRRSGVPDGYNVAVQFDALVGEHEDGLQEQLLDRLRDEVLTTTNLGAKGIDTSVNETNRDPDAGGLPDAGFRAIAEYTFRLTI